MFQLGVPFPVFLFSMFLFRIDFSYFIITSFYKVSKLRLLNQPLKLDQIPPKVINILKELSEKEKQSESIDLSKIGDSLIKTLFPFQEQGVRYLCASFY